MLPTGLQQVLDEKLNLDGPDDRLSAARVKAGVTAVGEYAVSVFPEFPDLPEYGVIGVRYVTSVDGRNYYWDGTEMLPVGGYEHFRGLYVSFAALNVSVQSPVPGDYAIVDAGVGGTAQQYIWDVNSGWVPGGSVTATQWGQIAGTLANQTDLASALTHVLPNNIAFNSSLAFDAAYAMNGINQSADITFTLNTVAAKDGGGGSIRIVCDGVHAVTVPVGLVKLANSPSFDDFTGIEGQAIVFCWERISGVYRYWLLEDNIVDSTAPVFLSGGTSDATHIQVTFSESVNFSSSAGFTASNGSSLAISAITGSGTATPTFTVGPMAIGQTITLSYNSSLGNVTDLAGNPLASFTNQTITNNIGGLQPLLFDTVNFLTKTGTTYTATAGGSTMYGNTGLSSQVLMGDGYILMDLSSHGGVLGMNSTASLTGYLDMEVGFLFQTGSYYTIDGGNLSSGTTIAANTNYRLNRVSNIWHLQSSFNGGAWANVGSQLAGNGNYPVCDVAGSYFPGELINPQIFGA